MNLDSLIFRWIARSSDALVRFVIALDARLDEFLEKADADVAGFEDSIGDLFRREEDEKDAIETTKQEAIRRIEEDAARRASEAEARAAAEKAALEDKLAETKRSRAILAQMKQSLPTGE